MTLALIAFIALTIDSTGAQTAGASDQAEAEALDPASNRLFWMSTGRVAAVGRGSIGFMGAPYLIPLAPYLTFAQGGYTPFEFLQFNATGSSNYWSIGTKVQFLPAIGVFQGVAAGADFGFYPQNSGIPSDNRVQAYNIAASVGSDMAEAHVNAMQVIQGSSYPSGSFPTYVQIGLALALNKRNTGGTKLMGELWYTNDYYQRRLELGLVLMGVRIYKRNFVLEFAFLFGPRLSLGHGSSSEGLQFLPLPYLSFMWFI